MQVELEALDPAVLRDLLDARIAPLLNATLIDAERQAQRVEQESLRRLSP